MTISDRRLQIYEILAFWTGDATASRVAEALGLTREAVQRGVVSRFRDRFGSLDYDEASRVVRFGRDGADSLKMAPSTALSFLQFLMGEHALAKARGGKPLLKIDVYDVREAFWPEVDPNVLSAIASAIEQKRPVLLEYISKKDHFMTRFSPHTIVNSAFRTHVRGYSDREDKNAGRFVDLLPGRMVNARLDEPLFYVGVDGDLEWRTFVDLELTLLDGIPDLAVEAVRREYPLDGDRLRISRVRKALASYVLEGFECRHIIGHSGPIWSGKILG